jgi:hypothetical protein
MGGRLLREFVVVVFVDPDRSSRTPVREGVVVREVTLEGGGRRGLPGGTCCLELEGLEKSIWGDDPGLPPIRPDIVILLPSSTRRC